MSEPTRREAIGAMAAGSALALAPQEVGAVNRQPDLTRIENAKPGTTDWQLTYAKFDGRAKYRQSLIEGYCTRMSVKAGEKIGFCVSTDPASAFTIDIYRLGYYGGAGGRLVRTLGPFEGKPQPTPPVGGGMLPHDCGGYIPPGVVGDTAGAGGGGMLCMGLRSGEHHVAGGAQPPGRTGCGSNAGARCWRSGRF